METPAEAPMGGPHRLKQKGNLVLNSKVFSFFSLIYK